MLTAKQHDFETFAHCIELVAAGVHKSVDGLIDLAELAATMNRQKPRHELIRILRGHTPDIRDIG